MDSDGSPLLDWTAQSPEGFLSAHPTAQRLPHELSQPASFGHVKI